jgi:cytochrome c oxidase cbb3-type subunit 3
MNNLKKSAFIFLAVLPNMVQAQAQTSPTFSLSFQDVLTAVIAVLIVVMFFLLFLMQKMLQVIKTELKGDQPIAKVAASEEENWWTRFAGVKPLSKEKDIMIDHDYDGIHELDNPTPPWFNLLFYGTIFFAIVYLINYHVIGTGKVMEDEYAAQMAEAEEQKKNFLATAANLVDESNITLVTETAKLEEGKTIFLEKCKACHGDKGQGTAAAPNLTDEYWLHGGSLVDVFKSIKYGWPAKGMISWQNQIKPEQMQNVASFIMSIQGTVPAGEGREPQGEKAASEGNAATPKDTASQENKLTTGL